MSKGHRPNVTPSLQSGQAANLTELSTAANLPRQTRSTLDPVLLHLTLVPATSTVSHSSKSSISLFTTV